jgi:tripartite-type tricarboxylate transporter receptor subunit TctC
MGNRYLLYVVQSSTGYSSADAPPALVAGTRKGGALDDWKGVMQMKKKAAWIVVFAAILGAVGGAAAAEYPSRPITIVVPFAAGGPTDSLARILAERMTARLGQPVIIEVITGAAGTIGVGRVARATADGYTLIMGNWSTHVVNGAIYALQYDLERDFQPIGLIASNPQLIVAKNSLPANDLRALIAWLKANGEIATEGTAGVGSPAHISGVFFQAATATHFQFVPYRGAAPVMQDLVAGQIDFTFGQTANALAQVRAGQVRAYAVTAKTRLASARDIPTVDEAGLPDFYISVWHALWAPKDTPKDIVAKLNAAVRDTLEDAGVVQRFADLGNEVPLRPQQSAEALRAYHSAEIRKWWPIIKAAKIKGE